MRPARTFTSPAPAGHRYPLSAQKLRFWNHQEFNEFEAVMAEIYRCLMLAR